MKDSDPEPAGVAILDAVKLAGYNENRSEGSEGLSDPPRSVTGGGRAGRKWRL